MSWRSTSALVVFMYFIRGRLSEASPESLGTLPIKSSLPFEVYFILLYYCESKVINHPRLITYHIIQKG